MPEETERFYNPNTKRHETRKVQKKESFDKSKYQGFSAGGAAPKEDPNAPKRSDFPAGIVGEGAYTKAKKKYAAERDASGDKSDKSGKSAKDQADGIKGR